MLLTSQNCFKGEGEGSTLFPRGGGVNIVTKGRGRGNIVSKGRERGERRNSSETTLRLLKLIKCRLSLLVILACIPKTFVQHYDRVHPYLVCLLVPFTLERRHFQVKFPDGVFIMLELQKKKMCALIYPWMIYARLRAEENSVMTKSVVVLESTPTWNTYWKTFKRNTTYLACVFFGLGFHIV